MAFGSSVAGGVDPGFSPQPSGVSNAGYKRREVSLFLAIFVLFSACRPAVAAPVVDDGSDIRISVITMGPGDAGYEKFGHIALRIEDPTARYPDVLFNWGIFDFNQKNFYFNFLQGRMIYMTAAEDGPLSLQSYRDTGRAVYEQVLHLTGAQKIELERRCIVACLDENKNYRYDYYRDNCSTRVRDMLDAVLHGQIKAQTASKPTGVTFRWHTRRLLTDDLPLYVALQAVLGHPVDEPITQWQEMFLPSKLRERLRELQITQADGTKAPLLESEQVVSPGTKPPEAVAPPHWVAYFLLAGMFIGGAFVGLALLITRKGRFARIGFVALGLAWLLLIGIGGAISAWGWLGTDHLVAKYNENLLQVTPLALILACLLPKASGGGRRMAMILSAIIAGLSILGLALKATPFFFQVNGDMIALCLPVHLALCWSFWRLSKLQPSTKTEKESPADSTKSRKRAGVSRSSRSPRSAVK